MSRKLRLYLRRRPADWKGFLSFLVDHGFMGVIMESTNGPWLRVASEIHRAGLEIGISRFPHPYPFEDALHDMLTDAVDVGAKELHVDIENGYGRIWQGARRRAFAKALDECNWLGDLVVTSYPSFPIKDFVMEGVGASVQVYDRFDNEPYTFAPTWIGRWERYGFLGKVRAGVGTFRLNPDGTGSPKPLPRMAAYLGSFPPGTDGDVWTLLSQQIEFRSHAAHYALLRAFAG